MTSPRSALPLAESGLRIAGTAVAVVASALVAVYGAFLTPYRVGATLVPISLVIGIAGNVAVIWFGYTVTRSRALALAPAAVWVILSFVASSRTREGDLVLISTDWVATAYLLTGAATIGVCAYRLTTPRRSNSPEVARRRSRIEG